MLTITLPDGNQKHFEGPISVKDVASSIGPGLGKAAIAGRLDDRLVDSHCFIHADSQLKIVTSGDADGLDIIRHSAAHLLAQSVKQLYPEAQVTIGPVIDNGFYYDFHYPAGFTPEDLSKIETRMYELAKKDMPVERIEISRDEAVALFEQQGEHYKVKIVQRIPKDEVLTLYRQGDFIDLCRGPHVPSTGYLKAFKLMKLAGAYWEGDANNEMLQRIYGTAWPDKKALSDYLYRLEEAERRDHRKLAVKMDLFHLQPEAPGMVFWHPNGWSLYQEVESYIRQRYKEYGYEEVRTSQLIDRSLLERSGHWGKFGENGIFTTHSDEHHELAIRPMNCPCHVQVYNRRITSYRDLPVRIAEFGSCHRNEPSGTLHGLMRLRHFTQDDGHIFCSEDQIEGEVVAFIEQLFRVYADFGFKTIEIKLSTRPEEHIGNSELWDKAEHALESALNQKNLEWTLQPGEGAFYGPKIEFSLRDSLGRVWQCGTMQLDFYIPGRLGAHYIAADGSKCVPVMLHRAILGSMERFIGVLLEESNGNLPVWLAPIQVVLMNITDKQAVHVKKIAEILKKSGLRVKYDLRNEKIGFKIREHTIS